MDVPLIWRKVWWCGLTSMTFNAYVSTGGLL